MSKSLLDSSVILSVQIHSFLILNLLNYLNILAISFTLELRQKI